MRFFRLITYGPVICLTLFVSSLGFASATNWTMAEAMIRRQEREYKQWRARIVRVTEAERAEVARLDPRRPTLLVIEGLSSGAGVMDAAEAALRTWEASTFYDVRRPGVCEWILYKLGLR